MKRLIKLLTVFNVLAFLMIITPLILSIGICVDYLHGIKYEEIPVWFAIPFGLITSFGLFKIWSITWTESTL